MSNRISVLEGSGQFSDFLYFFTGNQYYRYNWPADRMDDGYPRPLSAWKLTAPFSSGFQAAISGKASYEGKAYFFSGNQYLRYDWATDAVEGAPHSLDAWNFPGNFRNGVDAALNGVGDYEGKAYFFKGSEYIRYDWQADHPDDGYPQPNSAWNLPSDFAGGLVGAINGRGNYSGKAYFFKGDLYVRYDWSTNKVDDGYPQSVTAWGLPVTPSILTDEGFRREVGDLLARHEGRRAHVYLDTLNIPSIGIGFNLKRGGAKAALESVGADYDQVLAGNQDLTDDQIDALFNRDLETAFAASRRQVPVFDNLQHNAQLVVVDMMFMGEAAFATFKNMIAALQALDYNRAADEIQNSKWYDQVKNRGKEDVDLMRSAADA